MKTSNIALTLLFFALASIVIGTSACKKETSKQAETLKIGALLGFSGIGSQNAVETKAALDICLHDIRDFISRNKLDIEVELLVEDTKSDTAHAKTKMQLLIEKGVRLIIGPYSSTEALVLKPLADTHNVLLVSHSAVATSLALPGDNFLRFAPSDTYQAEALNAMFQSDSIEGIVAVVRNDLWSNSLMEAVRNVYTSEGGNVIATIAFEPGTTNFIPLVTDVKTALAAGASTVDANKIGIYFISYADGTDLLQALNNGSIATVYKLYGASAYAQNSSLPANTSAAAFALERNLQCPVFGFDEGAATIYQPIQKKLENVIGSKASIYALAAYDILWTAFLTSITQKAESEFATFKAHFIETASAHFGATGRSELDENGDRKHVFYDFWALEEQSPADYRWVITAKYSTTSHNLLKR
ncbi:ABC transporter substrate-binding protein [Bacteroidales bacterium]